MAGILPNRLISILFKVNRYLHYDQNQKKNIKLHYIFSKAYRYLLYGYAVYFKLEAVGLFSILYIKVNRYKRKTIRMRVKIHLKIIQGATSIILFF